MADTLATAQRHGWLTATTVGPAALNLRHVVADRAAWHNARVSITPDGMDVVRTAAWLAEISAQRVDANGAKNETIQLCIAAETLRYIAETLTSPTGNNTVDAARRDQLTPDVINRQGITGFDPMFHHLMDGIRVATVAHRRTEPEWLPVELGSTVLDRLTELRMILWQQDEPVDTDGEIDDSDELDG